VSDISSSVRFSFRTSQDDKFIVYASLKSGNSSCVVSRDEYKFLYQIETDALRFKEWMSCRRVGYSRCQDFNGIKLNVCILMYSEINQIC